jgi:hypothetical protein
MDRYGRLEFWGTQYIIQIAEMSFCKPDFIIIKSNCFQNAQKVECLLDDFEALVREIYVRG